MPTVAEWLRHASATQRIVEEKYADVSGDDLMTAAIKENVLVQLDNLRTHPSVASKLSQGELNLHAWVYTFENGRVFSFDPDMPVRAANAEYTKKGTTKRIANTARQQATILRT